MVERPILMCGETVNGILDGRKTHTRRVVQPSRLMFVTGRDGKPWPWNRYGDDITDENNVEHIISCPYGEPGDEMWVRETHYRFGKWIKDGVSEKTGRQKWTFKPLKELVLFADNPPALWRKSSYRKASWYKRPSIFLPHDYSRIQLRVIDIRVERIQDITSGGEMVASDVVHEGCPRELWACHKHDMGAAEHEWFVDLWDSINGKSGFGWSTNPWVWVVVFERAN